MSAGAQGYVGRAMRRMAPKTHTFICISDYVKNLVAGYGVPESKLTRIHCATQTRVRREFPSPLRKELGIGFDELVMGTTAIWRPNKGLPQFIAACELANRRMPGTRFLLGGKAYSGDTEYAAQIWMRGRLLRACGSLFYVGFIPDINRFMSALDVFILPSECEPFGLVLIEAMARGIPVIATRAGGVPEIVVQGETGLMVPPNDPQALADAIRYMEDNPLMRLQMGETARLRAQKFFDQKIMLDAYQRLYSRILWPQP